LDGGLSWVATGECYPKAVLVLLKLLDGLRDWYALNTWLKKKGFVLEKGSGKTERGSRIHRLEVFLGGEKQGMELPGGTKRIDL